MLKPQGCGFKIEPATPIWSSKLKWAWKAQFFSYALQIFKKYVFFEDVQMMLLWLFEFSDSLKVAKNPKAFQSRYSEVFAQSYDQINEFARVLIEALNMELY